MISHTHEDNWLADCEFDETHRASIDRTLGVSRVGTLPKAEANPKTPSWPVASGNKSLCGCRAGFTCRRHRLELIEVRKVMEAMEEKRER